MGTIMTLAEHYYCRYLEALVLGRRVVYNLFPIGTGVFLSMVQEEWEQITSFCVASDDHVYRVSKDGRECVPPTALIRLDTQQFWPELKRMIDDQTAKD